MSLTDAQQPQNISARFTADQGVRGAGIVLVSTIIGQGFFFLSQRTILSTISKEDNGFISLIFLCCSIVFGILVDSGMQGVTLRNAVRNPASLSSIITTAFWIRVVGAIIGIGIITAYFSQTETARLHYVLLGSLYFLIAARTQLFRSTLELPYRSTLSMKMVSLLSVAEYLLFFGLVTLFRNQLQASTVLLCYVFSSLPGFIYLSVQPALRHVFFTLPNKINIKEFLHDVLPISAQTLLLQSHSAIDLYYLNTLGYATVGVLGATSNMVFALSLVYSAVSSVVIPMISQQDGGTYDVYIQRITRVFNIVVFLMGLIVMVGGSAATLLIDIFTKSVYAGNESIVRLQFIFIALTFIANLCGLILMTLHEKKVMVLSGILLIIGSMTSVWWLVDAFGLHGFLYSKIWSNGLVILLFFGVIAVRFSASVLVRLAIPNVLYCLVVAVFVLFVSPLLHQWLAMGLAILISATSAHLFRLLTTEDWKLLLSPLDKIMSRLRS